MTTLLARAREGLADFAAGRDVHQLRQHTGADVDAKVLGTRRPMTAYRTEVAFLEHRREIDGNALFQRSLIDRGLRYEVDDLGVHLERGMGSRLCGELRQSA